MSVAPAFFGSAHPVRHAAVERPVWTLVAERRDGIKLVVARHHGTALWQVPGVDAVAMGSLGGDRKPLGDVNDWWVIS